MAYHQRELSFWGQNDNCLSEDKIQFVSQKQEQFKFLMEEKQGQ